MLRYLWRNKVLILLLILAVTMCPITISLPEQSRSESIVTAVGIDKKGEEYEVSIQYIVPQSSGGQENLKISKQKGKSVGEVFEKLNLEVGKMLGFAHCRFLVFNDEAGKDNLTKIFDYLLRQKTNTNNIVLISTKESAGDLLQTAKGIDSDLYTYLSNSGYSNEFKEYNNLTTIGDFYRSYFGETKCMSVYIVDTKEDTSSSSGGGETGGESSGSSESPTSSESSGSGSSSEKPKEISNKERLLIVKGNKALMELSKEESDDLIWFNKNIKRVQFEVKDFQDERRGSVDTMINVFKRIVKRKVYFDKQNNPHYMLSIKNYIRASQLLADSLSEEDYEASQTRFEDNFLKAVEEESLKKVKRAEKHFKENNYDVIDCYDLFYKYQNKKLREYLKTHSKEDFIKNVIFDYDLSFVQGS